MRNPFNMVQSHHYDQLRRMVGKARETATAESEESLKAALVYLVIGSCDWDRATGQPTHDEMCEFLFPTMGKFFLDGHLGNDEHETPILIARNTGTWWNGWAVPAPTYAQLADYAEQVRKVEPPELYREFMVALLEMYGGEEDNEGRATHTPAGWCWQVYKEGDTI